MAEMGEREGVVVGLACHVATNVRKMSVVGQKVLFSLIKSLDFQGPWASGTVSSGRAGANRFLAGTDSEYW